MKFAKIVTAALAAAFSVSTAFAATVLPSDTLVQVAPVNDITSKGMKEGDTVALKVATDVSQNGAVVIPRGSLVGALVTWRTGKGIGGKSAKFEIEFKTVTVAGKAWALKGKYREDGKGNTVAALLGSMVLGGPSAGLREGPFVNAFTAEPISVD